MFLCASFGQTFELGLFFSWQHISVKQLFLPLEGETCRTETYAGIYCRKNRDPIHQWYLLDTCLKFSHFHLTFKKIMMLLCRSWNGVQIFGLQSACCLTTSTRGLLLLCREDWTNRGNSGQKSIISEWPSVPPDLYSCCTESKSLQDLFVHSVTRQRLYSWMFYTWRERSEKHKEEMLSERMVRREETTAAVLQRHQQREALNKAQASLNQGNKLQCLHAVY